MQSDNIKDSIKDIQKDYLLSDRKSFITLKVERIAIAAYRVTDFLAQEEPLKWKIRSVATEMVLARVSQIAEPLSRLSRLFSVAIDSQIGSSMNFSILSKECSSLSSLLIEEDKEIIKKEIVPKGHTGELGSRADTILGILKATGESSISSIAAQLPSVSEKTVQRELITLVERGVVNRVGERRWSKYKLATTD